MRPLHLVLVGPWPPYRGGIAHFTAGLARALRARGHRVEGVSFARQYPARLFPGRSQREPGAPPADLPPAPEWLDSVAPRSWFRTAAYLRARQPDAVVFQHWLPFFAPAYGTVARALGRAGARRVRRLAVVHNALPHERRPGDVVLSRYLLRALDGALALSEAVRADLGRLAPGLPVGLAAHPVAAPARGVVPRAEARRRLGLPEEAPVLLFFGFVRRYKGLDVLLEALPAVRARLPEVHLLVAGECYEDPAVYRRQAERLGVAEAVHFGDRYLPDDEVALVFGAADVVVQPYRSATQSGVAAMAFGFGVPVITTTVGGLAETVLHEEAGLVVPPEDPAALAAAVTRFFGEPGLAARLRAGARARGDVAGWDAVCAALEALARGAPAAGEAVGGAQQGEPA